MKKMKRSMFTFQGDNMWEKIIVVALGSLLYIFGAKLFIQSTNLYTGGILGISQLTTSLIYEFTPLTESMVKIDLASLIFLLINTPIFFLGFKHLGRRFTLLSFFSVILVTIAGSLINVDPIISGEQHLLINSVFGGVIVGLGIGICLKVGASTGGTDIVSQYLSLKYNASFGAISFIINASIVLVSGIIFGWPIALYTIINIFIVTTVINYIHTRNQKLLVTIITNNPDLLIEEIHSRMIRGITIVPVIGAYSRENKTMLYTVVTSYELYNIKQFILEFDPTAFVNITKSHGVFGAFLKPKV